MCNERTQDETCACQLSSKSRASADCTEENTSSKTGIRVLLTGGNIGWKYYRVHWKIKILTSFTHLAYIHETQQKMSGRMFSMQKKNKKTMVTGAVSLDILSITAFCFSLKKDSNLGLGQDWGRVNYDRSFVFAWTLSSQLIKTSVTFYTNILTNISYLHSHFHCTDK